MSCRSGLAVLVFLGSAVTALAQAVTTTVTVVEKADREGQTLVIKQTITEYQTVTKQVVAVVNGQNQVREVTEAVPVLRERLVTIAVKGLKGYSGDGKALADKDLWDRLRAGSAVVLGDERLLRPPFNKTFRPEAVLLLNSAPTPAPMPRPEK